MVSITILKYFMVRNLLPKKIILCINVESWKKTQILYLYIPFDVIIKDFMIFFQTKYSIFSLVLLKSITLFFHSLVNY